ncbi:845_t:CDS:1, partial [Paraglomus brasilianum]
YRNYKNRPESLATQAWNAMRDDGTSNDEKFLGLTRRKVKNPQTREQFNQWRTKWMESYKQCNLRIPLDIYVREYEEYYIPVNWIDSKKSQLRDRFSKRLQQLEV